MLWLSLNAHLLKHTYILGSIDRAFAECVIMLRFSSLYVVLVEDIGWWGKLTQDHVHAVIVLNVSNWWIPAAG